MIKKVTIYCSFYGKEFSAKNLQKSLPLLSWDIYQEQGEIATTGRYKGQLSPYSHSLLRPAPYLSNKAEIENLLQLLKHYKSTLEQFVIENIEINIQLSYTINSKLIFTTILLDRYGKIVEIEDDFIKTSYGQDFLINTLKNNLALAHPNKKLLSNYEVPLSYNKLIVNNATN